MIFPVGDSKTFGSSTDTPPGRGYPQYLCDDLHLSTGDFWTELTRYAVPGGMVSDVTAGIDAILSSRANTPQPYSAWIGLGAVDVLNFPLTEATWKADYAYILDAIRAKWSQIKIYNTICWRRNYATECDTLATWMTEVLADGRSSWAFSGDDERVWMENGDDGITYTDDGVHPNHAGYLEAATQRRAVMGF